jgi:hypothetical protein
MSDSIPIAAIKKNSREEIRMSLDMFNGHRLFNMRVFFEAEDGSMRPGKNGLAFKVEKLSEFAQAVSAAAETAKSKGFLK